MESLKERDPRVFIIHQVLIPLKGSDGVVEWHSRHNYEMAKEYGRLINVLETRDFFGDPERFMDILANKLHDFNDNDSILCTGDPLGLLASGMILMALGGGWSRVRILRWNKHTSKYDSFDIRARAMQLIQEHFR